MFDPHTQIDYIETNAGGKRSDALQVLIRWAQKELMNELDSMGWSKENAMETLIMDTVKNWQKVGEEIHWLD